MIDPVENRHGARGREWRIPIANLSLPRRAPKHSYVPIYETTHLLENTPMARTRCIYPASTWIEHPPSGVRMCCAKSGT